MPLRDHFVPPLSVTHPWSGFLGAWAVTITQQLNDVVLPARYYALPRVEFDGSVEIDLTIPYSILEPAPSEAEPAFRPWTPRAPDRSLPADFGSGDTIEVQVFSNDGGPRLVCAVELVTPENKDRPSSLRAFAVKCEAYLRQAVSLIVIDIVTVRHANIYAEIYHALELDESAAWQSPSGLCTVAYRVTGDKEGTRLEMWPEPLGLGASLSTLPLWLDSGICVPLDLEKSYLSACASLRISS